MLGADAVVGLLGEAGVLGEARAVHQVEDVAVVGAVVEEGGRLRDAVALLRERQNMSTY